MNVLEIALGGLLHDIGKFSQRAYISSREGLSPQSERMTSYLCPTGQHGNPTHIHVLYTNEFVENLPFLPTGLDRSTVANLAAFHHRPDTAEQRVIAKADHLSSGMERYAEDDDQAKGARRFRKVRLQSVASTVSTPESGKTSPAAVPLSVLSPQKAFPLEDPEEENLTPEYQRLWQQFVSAWPENRCPDAVGYINRAMSTLERFTWCIPSATNVVPDISLYDHLKTTAAIAVCLAETDESTDKPFLFVGADLNGIQRYIFEIRPGTGGLARRLRARSFKVAAYLEAISLAILKRLGLPLTQVILFAGGKFHMLLPNNPATHETLEEVNQEAGRWLFDESSGEVGLSHAAIPLAEEGLASFADSVTCLNARLRESRERAAETMLIANGSTWKEPQFVLPLADVSASEQLCESCHRRKGQAREVHGSRTVVCHHCMAEGNLGRLLPGSRYIAFYSDRKQREAAPIGSFELFTAGDNPPDKPDLLIDFDGIGGADNTAPVVGVFRGRHIPCDATTGATATFEDLARCSQGHAALGYLKMDVDDLGYVLSRGLKGVNAPLQSEQDATAARDRTSISRVAALSRTLETFFSGYLEQLLRREFLYVYLIYSGGDDLAAVGPWDKMFDLALRIRQDFHRFTGGNACWTLSAGIAVQNPRVPVLSAVADADSLLEASKDIGGSEVVPWPAPDRNGGVPQKDRITALGVSMPWPEFPQTLGTAKRLLGWLQSGTVNTGKVRRLLQYAWMAREFQRTGNTAYLQYVPYLVRDVRRNWTGETPAEREAQEWAASLTLPDSSEIRVVQFVCQYALYGNRRKTSEE